MKIAAVVLAAGASTRLGEAKQNVRIGTETLLERTVRLAHLAGLGPVFVVVAPDQSFVLSTNTRVVINHDAAEGMASSIRTGISAAIAAEANAAIILACDQPWITEEHLRELAKGGDEVVASEYAGRKGIPAYFPATAFDMLMRLSGDTGAREMLRGARAVFLNKGELDIDTADDLKRARELYASDPPL